MSELLLLLYRLVGECPLLGAVNFQYRYNHFDTTLTW